MPLQRHHKILIGSFTTVVLIFMITSSTLLYLLFVKSNVNYSVLTDKIETLQKETDTKISGLSEGLIETKNLVGSELGSLNKELDLLKASAGEDFSGIVESAVSSVVTIRTNSGQGTGFIINSQGYIVTNAHVIADSNGNLASGIQAITSDSNARSAEFVGYEGDLDIALLKISGTWGALEFGDSEDVSVGEKVIAIGNPLGLQFSVSQGIVSAVHRTGGNGLDAYIQTDAALNPGNSGGPLINILGKVIGINNFKIGGGENLGFALESNYIVESVNKIAQEELNQTLIN